MAWSYGELQFGEVPLVHVVMSNQLVAAGKLLLTVGPATVKRLLACFTCMSPGVCLKVVRPRELSLTRLAFERFYSCVPPLVSFKLIGPRKPPTTVCVLTLVRLLPCVFAAVHLQMGQFEVALVTARVGAHEGAFLAALRAHDGGSDPGHSPHVLDAPENSMCVDAVLRATAVNHRSAGVTVVAGGMTVIGVPEQQGLAACAAV